jgi:hypothetical protein
MTPELVQLAFYAGFTLLGWFLRHKGIAAPATPVAAPVITPVSNGGHVTEAAVLQMLESLLAKLNPPATSSVR